jgi:SAM-dependent methyltransferase
VTGVGSVRTLLRKVVPAPARAVVRQILQLGTRNHHAVSTGYQVIAPAEIERVAAALGSAWQDPAMPRAQLAVAEAELQAFARSERVPVFDVFVNLLKRVPDVGAKTLLEVGCSSGYYADVLRLRGLNTRYTGCDFSSAFIDLGRSRQPGIELEVQDATRLRYPDRSRDIVVSGCCILHIADYPAAIREAARVAREYVLFHRTPVLHTTPTTFYRKLAYGVQCLEIHFNETELLRHFRVAGLRVVDAETVSLGGHAPAGDVLLVKSYLCEKT